MRALPLKRCELIIYAILYAFAKSDSGLFYGTKRHLAYLSGLSERTVYRGLLGLLTKGFIEEVITDNRKALCITPISDELCSDPYLPREYIRTSSEIIEEKNEEKETENIEKPTEKFTKRLVYRIENDAPILPLNSKSSKEELRGDLDAFLKKSAYLPRIKPRYEVLAFGRYGYVGMTREQYMSLLETVDSETLTAYIRRYEMMLENNTGEFRPHSAYKTIKRWLHEDYSA